MEEVNLSILQSHVQNQVLEQNYLKRSEGMSMAQE